MKIAVFSDTYLPQVNGVANVVAVTSAEMAAMGHEVRIYAISDMKQRRLERLVGNNGVRIRTLSSIPFPGYPGLRLMVHYRRLIPEIRAWRPDVIHTHTPFGVGLAAIRAARSIKAPLVGTHHTFLDDYLKYVAMDFTAARNLCWRPTIQYYNQCGLVTCASLAMESALLKFGLTRRTVVIGNPVSSVFYEAAERFKREALREEFSIRGFGLIYVGRLSYEKNVHQVIETAAHLKHDLKRDIMLTVVGDGPDRPKLERYAKSLAIDDCTVFHGRVPGPEVARMLMANDLFVTTSKSDNMPLCVLEAMAVGVPIAAVKERGLGELVDDGVNGIVLPTDDSCGSANRIAQLIGHEDFRARLAENSYTMGRRYHSRAICEEIVGCYEEIIETSGLRRHPKEAVGDRRSGTAA